MYGKPNGLQWITRLVHYNTLFRLHYNVQYFGKSGTCAMTINQSTKEKKFMNRLFFLLFRGSHDIEKLKFGTMNDRCGCFLCSWATPHGSFRSLF